MARKNDILSIYTKEVEQIKADGLFKGEAPFVSPQGAKVVMEDGRELLNMCANNYLGLGDNQRLIDAAKKTYDEKGAVRLNIGIFTDTYFPQVSGVATSIKTLRDELIAQGHHVYIFTTTDPKAKHDDVENGIYRFASIPFVSFSDRRIAVRGVFRAIKLAKKFQLDIVHNQTEFALGVMGKTVAKHLHIPCLHTYHTMYQDYLHYIANGHILKPNDVARLAHLYLKNLFIIPSFPCTLSPLARS